MLTHYEVLDQVKVDRQGQSWWACDVAACTAEAQIVDGKIPDGWATSDPDQNPLEGAAQMCPKHASKITPPPPQ